MTRADFTYIAIVLDRSGSMESVRADTIGGFNQFLSDHRNSPGRNLLTLVQFDNEYQIVHDGCPIADVPNLHAGTYVPRGSTALIDAIGLTIDRLGHKFAQMPEHERPSKVIMCVITDGQENSSSAYISAPRDVYLPDISLWQSVNPFVPQPIPAILQRGGVANKFARVQGMIAHQRERYQWEFVFLGANEDGIAQAVGSMGFQHVYAYNATPTGSRQVFGAVSKGIASYRGGRSFNIGGAEGIRAVVTPESSSKP